MEKINRKRSYDPKAECMVRAIGNGNNVKAYKCLEQIVKEHMSKKIDNALKEC